MFEYGKIKGHGIWYQKDGVTKWYEGESNGKYAEGLGIWYRDDGVTKWKEGNFKKDKLHGHGTEWKVDGSHVTGEWFEGKISRHTTLPKSSLF